MNTKLFISEQLRKIFTSAELLEKKSILKQTDYLTYKNPHTIAKWINIKAKTKHIQNGLGATKRICAHDSTAHSLVPQEQLL